MYTLILIFAGQVLTYTDTLPNCESVARTFAGADEYSIAPAA